MTTRSQSLLLLLPAVGTACAYDPEPIADEDLLVRLAGLEASVAAQQVLIDDCQTVNLTQQSELEDLQRASEVLTTTSGLSRFIDDDLTLDVPSAYDDINAALAALDGSVISPAATVTIQVADGSYAYDEAITVDHPNGGSIHIVGDEADPSAVVLDFVASDGVVIGQGKHLGFIGGVTLTGDPTGGDVGLHVQGASSTAWGPLVIADFGLAGVWVEDNGVLYPADTGCVNQGIEVVSSTYGVYVTGGGFANLCHANVSQIAQEGIYALHGGVIFAKEAQVVGGGSSFSSFDAYKVVNGAVLYAVGASASNVNDVGFEVRHGASAILDEVTTSGGEAGYYVGDGSSLLIDNEGTVSDSTYGYRASLLGALMGTNLDASGYTSAAFSALRAGSIQVTGATCNAESCSTADIEAGATPAEGSIWY